jgi:hypothetical protein
MSSALYIFNLLLYGCEIWGFDDNVILVKVRLWYFGLLSTNIFARKEIMLSLLSISTGYLPNSPYSIYHIIRNKYLDVQNHFTKFQAYFY